MAHAHGDMNEVVEKFVPDGTNGLHPVESSYVGDTTVAEAEQGAGDMSCAHRTEWQRNAGESLSLVMAEV